MLVGLGLTLGLRDMSGMGAPSEERDMLLGCCKPLNDAENVQGGSYSCLMLLPS
jgi:hypothetical protein